MEFIPFKTNISQTIAPKPPKKPMRCIGWTRIDEKDGKRIKTIHKYNDDGTETVTVEEEEI